MKPKKFNTVSEFKRISANSVKSRDRSRKSENPTPRQFDQFLPWLCQQMHICPHVAVERITKEKNISIRNRGYQLSRSKSIFSTIQSALDFTKIPNHSLSLTTSYSDGYNENTIVIKSYYNNFNQLIELAIVDCPPSINRKVIQAISLCLPFHSYLKKFKINGNGLTESVLYEIGKLLPHSNITDICLDDTYLPEGNYYVLLDKLNNLQNLSLCKCKINDDVCKKIAEKLHNEMPASNTLMTLDFTSNNITNSGARHLGLMLRQNRTLLYLGLADNLLDDVGASHILKPLMVFSLTEDEVYELRKRKFRYAAKKLEICKEHEKQLIAQMNSEEDKENNQPVICRKSIGRSKHLYIEPNSVNVKELAAKNIMDTFGKFEDVFDEDNVVYRNGHLYSLGNLKLCYLNLAYNHLSYFSLKKLCEVLKYQTNIKQADCRGLLRVVVNGNNIPTHCELLNTIESYLVNAVANYATQARSRSRVNMSKYCVRK
ncbi:leucine-rich repeat-containing protein 71 [Danaus plexippus plexippus]|uniref:Leucine-rich repeat-containing protein 71 n=1 Tax=Danaus plexippus plexippus TaxID=278856 RepID=A0A212FDP0_DANPL|nr:leucine-rich repeat-containing protein 71 [Danaus plexippus plexippus]